MYPRGLARKYSEAVLGRLNEPGHWLLACSTVASCTPHWQNQVFVGPYRLFLPLGHTLWGFLIACPNRFECAKVRTRWLYRPVNSAVFLPLFRCRSMHLSRGESGVRRYTWVLDTPCGAQEAADKPTACPDRFRMCITSESGDPVSG